MGKMKEEFMKMQTEGYFDNMSDAEYQDWLNSQKDDCCGGDCHCKGESATQEEVQAEHDAWWDSLTDEQKQQLYNDKEEAFKLSIEEMNYDLSFGK